MAVLASVAMDLVNDKAANRAKMDSYVEKAAAQNADFVLFPELALGGVPKNPMFIFNPDDAKYQHDVAELVPEGDSTQHFIEMAKKLDIYIGWGMAEQSHERFDALYNTLVVVGPEGFVGKYRKVHQPLTERIMFYSGSGDYPVFDTRFGKIGLIDSASTKRTPRCPARSRSRARRSSSARQRGPRLSRLRTTTTSAPATCFRSPERSRTCVSSWTRA